MGLINCCERINSWRRAGCLSVSIFSDGTLLPREEANMRPRSQRCQAAEVRTKRGGTVVSHSVSIRKVIPSVVCAAAILIQQFYAFRGALNDNINKSDQEEFVLSMLK